MSYLFAIASATALFAFGLTSGQDASQNSTPTVRQVHKLPPRHFEERPPVSFELAPSEKLPGRALVTNLHQEALTAFALQVEPESGSQKPPKIEVFDALARVGMFTTIPRGLTFIIGIPHIVGKPIPEAKIAAAIWEDGSTFGPAEILDNIFQARRVTLSAYDLVISILQTGMEKNWTVSQCVDALEKEKTALPTLSEPPRVPMPAQPNSTIFVAETALRSNTQSARPQIAISSVLTVLKETRDKLARTLPEGPQDAPDARSAN